MGLGMKEESNVSLKNPYVSESGYGTATETDEIDAADATDSHDHHEFAVLMPDETPPSLPTPSSPSPTSSTCVTVPVTPEAPLEAQSVMERLTDEERRRRLYLHVIANTALVQELLFMFFQIAATRKGLTHLGANDDAATATAIPLSIADWLMNVLAVSVPADADAVLWSSEAHLSRAWHVLATLVKGVSLLGSYSVGAAADALPLLYLVPQGWPAGALAAVNYPLILVNILPGASYYRLFNHTKIFNHLKVLREFSQDPSLLLRRLVVQPINALRYFEVARAWLTVVGYRSISFAFIAQALAPYLVNPIGLSADKNTLIADALAVFALLATAVNVMFSRLLPAYRQLALLDFDAVEPAEYLAAARQWRREAFASRHDTAMTLLHGLASLVPKAITAAGWVLLAGDVFETQWQQSLLQMAIGGASLLNHNWVEYQALISCKALFNIRAASENNDVAARLRRIYRLNDDTSHSYAAMSDDDASMQAQLKVTDRHFEQLKHTFAQAHPLLNTAMVAVNVAARAARCIGFYGFIKTLSATLTTYTGMEISEQKNIALCLILAPENFINELAVFDESMKSVMQNWHAKCYIETHVLGRSLSAAQAIKVCLVNSPYDYSPSVIQQAIRLRALDVSSPLFPPPSESATSPLHAISTPSAFIRLSTRLCHSYDSVCTVM